MNKSTVSVVALGVIAALAFSGCASNDRGGPSSAPPAAATPTAAATGASGPATSQTFPTFDAHATIGVSLPQKTSENWVLAEGQFNDQLTAAGFKPMVSFANSGVAEQQSQISAMITAGAKLIVVGPIDGSKLSSQLAAAKQSGITVIAFDRNLMNTKDVDLYITYDPVKAGELNAQALLDGLRAKKGSDGPPWNIEMVAGDPQDNVALQFWKGNTNILQPKIDDGTLKVVSGQTSFQQCATAGWLAQNGQKRMDAVLSANYAGGTKLSGVQAVNDTLARAALTSVHDAGLPVPVVTGMDSETATIPLIADGTQYSTINKDAGKLVEAVVSVVKQIQAGQPVKFDDVTTYDNGTKIVPTVLLTPVLVTKENLCTAYDPVTSPSAAKAAADSSACKG